MDILGRRVNLAGRDQEECAGLDRLLPTLESEAGIASGEARSRAEVSLYKVRKRFFDLKC